MSKVKSVAGVLVGVLVLGVVGGGLWLKHGASARLNQRFEAHSATLQVPFPLSETEIASLREEALAAAPPAEDGAAPADPLAGVDLDALASTRAIARGKHLVEARYVCVECHGRDFGGGVMVEDGAIGSLHGPNLTAGQGGVVASYTVADWDRIVRHGIKPDGAPAVMPSGDFVAMSDRELSDILAYIGSMPPVDRPSDPPRFGPLGTALVALGQWPLSAEIIADHQATHAVEPPEEAATAEFGKHLAQICTGCHGGELAGGPIEGAPPDWPPAANLTPHADGLSGWSFEQFQAAMQAGKDPSGRALLAPMTLMTPYANQMTETELRALWAWLSSVPPRPDPA